MVTKGEEDRGVMVYFFGQFGDIIWIPLEAGEALKVKSR